MRFELSGLVPELAAEVSPPVQLDDEWRRLRLFDSIHRLLAAVANEASLVAIVEDVHWADPSSLQLLDYLMAPGHRTGVPFIITGRVDESDPIWLDSVIHSGLERLELGLLDLAATKEQAFNLLGRTLSEADLREVYRRTGGHRVFLLSNSCPQLVRSAPERYRSACNPSCGCVLNKPVRRIDE